MEKHSHMEVHRGTDVHLHSFDVEVLRAKGGKTSTKYVAANPNVGISGGSSAQTGHTCTWSTQLLSAAGTV